jgi:hypothetical protein
MADAPFGRGSVRTPPRQLCSARLRLTGVRLCLTLTAIFCLTPGVRAEVPHRAGPGGVFQGVYLTSWSAGTRGRVEYVLDLARTGRINSVVIDIKDTTGYVTYPTALPEAARYGARGTIIRDIDGVVRELHEAGLYVIARIAVFQDPRLAVARPDLAVHRRSLVAAEGGQRSAETLWLDRKNIAWVDPAAEEAWAYNLSIARDALERGFDEINFDYIRFPSDGDLRDLEFSVWDGTRTRSQVIEGFFRYLREQLQRAILSVDLFGLSTVNHDDLGVGQIIESAYLYFDYVCPMVYPSHYAPGFRGLENPAEHPYEVVSYSMTAARRRLEAARARGLVRAQLRPWLQDFSLGAVYHTAMVVAQIEATREGLGSDYAGFLLWSASNTYTTAALPAARPLSRASSSQTPSSLRPRASHP